MTIFSHPFGVLRGNPTCAEGGVPVALTGSVDEFVAVRSGELDRWFLVVRVLLGLGLAGYLSVDVLQHAAPAASLVLVGGYLALNAAAWLFALRRAKCARWLFAAIDVAAIVTLRQFFSFEFLVDANATMVGFFTLILLVYTVYGDPLLSRAISIGTISVAAATMCIDLLGDSVLHVGVVAYQRYPLRMLVILAYLGSFCLVTYAVALRLREHVLDYSVELHRRIEAAMATSSERTRREKLEELNRLKRDFISILSHELRTPLAPLRSSLELLRTQEAVRPENGELLGIAMESTDKLQRLVQDYTQLAELLTCEEAGTIRWNLRLSTLVETLRDQGALSCVAVQGVEGLVVVADPRLLAGALLALIRRATLVNSPGTHITIRAYPADRDVLIEIHDPQSYLERDLSEMLDDPFVVSSERTFVSANTGLELILARHSLQRIGGKLRITSDPHEGTTIHCSVPAMKQGAHWLSDAQLRFELEPLRLHTAA